MQKSLAYYDLFNSRPLLDLVDYPSLEAPEELELEDLGKLEKDTLYAAGMQVVQQILDEMAAAGRTRRAQPEPPPQHPGAAAAAK